VIPPLSEANIPILSDVAKGMLKHYMVQVFKSFQTFSKGL
jgi:hypothetical protein